MLFTFTLGMAMISLRSGITRTLGYKNNIIYVLTNARSSKITEANRVIEMNGKLESLCKTPSPKILGISDPPPPQTSGAHYLFLFGVRNKSTKYCKHFIQASLISTLLQTKSMHLLRTRGLRKSTEKH
uniref:Uncharacterized protein n=1 Tax=Romanomermis culicivorax TaxID=13658 RepID=A0A915HY17_ROMCU